MKIASGCSRPANAGGATPSTNKTWHAACGGVSRDPCRAFPVGLDGDRAHRAVRQHPLDCHRPRTRADIPEQFAPARRQRSQRHGADLAFGDLAIMLEQVVGKPKTERENACIGLGYDLDRDEVQWIDPQEARRLAACVRVLSAGPPSASSTVSRD